jgi:hypothetical protein
MCTLGFQGKGYSLDFIKNYKKIIQTLSENEDTLIEVAEYMDDICSVCPNKLDEVLCKTQDKITELDRKHSAVLQLKPGEIMSWRQAKERIKTHMSVEKFTDSCSVCSWQKYGVCQRALESLVKN